MVTTVGLARDYAGPGTMIYWRPANTPTHQPLSDEDVAVIGHVSTEEDKYFAAASIERERRMRS